MRLGQAILVEFGRYAGLVVSVCRLSVDSGPLQRGVLVRRGRFGGWIVRAAVLETEFCLHINAYGRNSEQRM